MALEQAEERASKAAEDRQLDSSRRTHTTQRPQRRRARTSRWGGPGDPGLLTARALELIASADTILYDRLIPPQALDGARADAELLFVGKQGGGESVPQEQTQALMIERARAGREVVRLKGGDPFVFGRGGEEALALREAGIDFERRTRGHSGRCRSCICGHPGDAPRPFHRGGTRHRAYPGRHPYDTRARRPQGRYERRADSDNDNDTRRQRERAVCRTGPELDWAALAAFPGTLVFYMGVRQLPHIAERLIAAGRAPSQPVALVERGTLPDQRTVSGTLATIAEVASASK